jgi:hypothetical protein
MIEPPGYVVRIERTFDAPREAVFDAWTSPEVLRRWFHCAPDWETPEAEVDLQVGGKIRVVMRKPDGSKVSVGGERDVDGSARCTLSDPEVRLARLSETYSGDVVLPDQLVAERGESLLVEALAPFEVRHGKTNVIQHRSPPAVDQNEPTSVRRSILIMRSFASANFRECSCQAVTGRTRACNF